MPFPMMMLLTGGLSLITMLTASNFWLLSYRLSPPQAKWGYYTLIAVALFLIPGFILACMLWNVDPLYRFSITNICSAVALCCFLTSLPKKIRNFIVYNHPNGTVCRIKMVGFVVLYAMISVPATTAMAKILTKIITFISPSYGINKQLIAYMLSEQIARPSARLWHMLSALTLSAPIAEEILFRGFIQNYFKTKVSTSSAILLTSCVFSMIHFENTPSLIENAIILPTLFCLSIFLGAAYETTKTLIAPMSLHIAYNVIQTVLYTCAS